MAYTPINWQAGDTITAEKLNKMDNGWGLQEAQLFSETVTTESMHDTNGAVLHYPQAITNDAIIVTFDGTDYECNRIDLGEGNHAYGGFSTAPLGPDYTDYPFFILSGDVGNMPGEVSNILYTETAGTYAISVIGSGIVTSSNFNAAVNKAVVKDSAFEVISGTTTWQEVHDALVAGKYVYTVAEYADSGDNITSVRHALRADTEGYEVIFAEISGNTNPTLSIFHLSASSADGVLNA